jgi:hypothetical protein
MEKTISLRFVFIEYVERITFREACSGIWINHEQEEILAAIIEDESTIIVPH